MDLIVGLPGDTVESVRRGLHYLHDDGLCSDVQVFNLAVLPGTAFRQEAAELGLVYQPRPPYYVLSTPTLDRADLFGLMQEAQDLFDIEFDAQPPPVLDFAASRRATRVWRVDLDARPTAAARRRTPRPGVHALAALGPLRPTRRGEAAALIREMLADNPFTTLQVVLEPAGGADAGGRAPAVAAAAAGRAAGRVPGDPDLPRQVLRPAAGPAERGEAADRAAAAGPAAGSSARSGWRRSATCATLVWRGPAEAGRREEMEAHEYAWVS